MNRRKKELFILSLGSFILLLSSLFTNMLLSFYYADKQYTTSSGFVDWLIEEYPNDEQKIMRYIKEHNTDIKASGEHYLDQYGFNRMEFWKPYKNIVILSSVCCVFLLVSLFIVIIYLLKTVTKSRIQSITDYLTRANTGKDVTILSDIEDDFSALEDEIYKTVTEMRIAKETAIKERQNFAESLANIAHQIKTPVTSMSVTTQMFKGKLKENEIEKLKKQIDKINQLTDALLTISKIDAGILELKQDNVDVYTLLELSVEALESQIRRKEIEVVLPNHPEISFTGDLDWSVEVFINLIKNSIEHMPDRGRLSFHYEENPLYAEISVMDNGEGFDDKEIPYIFNRFYQGKQGRKSGTGIGLSMAKSIIEMQNGFITAKNLKGGGACFIVRFYCH